MMFLTKPEYTELRLPFRFVDDPADLEAGGISIEAYGTVYGQMKYCFAAYDLKHPRMYENGDYEQMIGLLKNSVGKTVKVTFQLKKGVPKGFKIDVDSLAEAYGDERFKALDLLAWGLNDARFEELRSR